MEIIIFFFLLGHYADKEIVEVANLNKINCTISNVRYMMRILMDKLQIFNRTLLRKTLIHSQFNSNIPLCFVSGIVHNKFLDMF